MIDRERYTTPPTVPAALDLETFFKRSYCADRIAEGRIRRIESIAGRQFVCTGGSGSGNDKKQGLYAYHITEIFPAIFWPFATHTYQETGGGADFHYFGMTVSRKNSPYVLGCTWDISNNSIKQHRQIPDWLMQEPPDEPPTSQNDKPTPEAPQPGQLALF